MTSSVQDLETEAIKVLVTTLGDHFNLRVDNADYRDNIYSIIQAPKFNNVFFIKLKTDSELYPLCMLSCNVNKSHSGPSRRSYSVNVLTKKVVCICFSSKCKKRNGGKYMFQDVETSSEDETEEESKKRQRRD
jgi:hypothetical protein